ncbi:MAG: hypothetical protein Q9184_004677 [Pyrenodesmia sp. 2 TL-2023]
MIFSTLLHQTYDQWVLLSFTLFFGCIRIGPNTVLFNTPEAYRDIYNYKANVKKNKTYDAWRRNERDANTLNVTDVAIHAKKRKLLNTVFSDRAVRSTLDFVINHLDRWNELTVTGDGWSEPINLTKWSDCLVFDILGDLCFGKSFDTKEPGETTLGTYLTS